MATAASDITSVRVRPVPIGSVGKIKSPCIACGQLEFLRDETRDYLYAYSVIQPENDSNTLDLNAPIHKVCALLCMIFHLVVQENKKISAVFINGSFIEKYRNSIKLLLLAYEPLFPDICSKVEYITEDHNFRLRIKISKMAPKIFVGLFEAINTIYDQEVKKNISTMPAI